MPLVASTGAVYGLAAALPPGAGRTWWGLTALLVTAVLVAVAVERAARRLLPIALLLKLSMIFPDRAPSRLRLARAAATRTPKEQLLWTGTEARPTSTSELVLDLVAALGTHDRRTRGHSERVRLLTDMLAAELKLDQDARDRLRWSALLHDVGKMEVSPSILNKPGRLDAREFATVQQHPAAGALLAAPLLPWLGTWGEGIVDHHEKYDGTGYPAGKAGEEISLAGRLIGLIDAFETMTAARPYKKAMATKAAREELARCAGTHFDPVLVRAFLTISLPRVLWAMGPLSFLLQLPFLRPLAHAGSKTTAVAPQAANALATSAAGAAGAAVLVTSGVAAPMADTDLPDRRQVASSQLVVPPAPSGTAPAPLSEEREPAPAAAAPEVEATPAAAARVAEPVAAPAAPARPQPPTAAPRAPRPASPPDTAEAAPAPADPAPEKAPADEPADPPTADEPADPPPPAPDQEPDVPADEPADPSSDAPPAAPETAPPADAGTPPQEPAPDPAPADEAPVSPDAPPPAETAPEPVEEPQPVAGGDTSQAGGAILSGPPSFTASREARFELAPAPGGSWECQTQGNGGGETSAWTPCSGTWSLTVVKDGQHTVRVRDAATGEQAGSWTWTVVSGSVSARAAGDIVVLDLDLGVQRAPVPDAPPTTLLAYALAMAGALPLAAALRRRRSRRSRRS